MLSDLKRKYPALESDQKIVITALASHLNDDDPATSGDVHYEIRKAIQREFGDVYPEDVASRLDQLETTVEELSSGEFCDYSEAQADDD